MYSPFHKIIYIVYHNKDRNNRQCRVFFLILSKIIESIDSSLRIIHRKNILVATEDFPYVKLWGAGTIVPKVQKVWIDMRFGKLKRKLPTFKCIPVFSVAALSEFASL